MAVALVDVWEDVREAVPAAVPEVVRTLREIRGHVPLFGICLGHQLISLSYGAKTYKLKFGHRGGNHPVKDIRTGKIEITSQNHSYAVDEASLAGTGLTVSHINLLVRKALRGRRTVRICFHGSPR